MPIPHTEGYPPPSAHSTLMVANHNVTRTFAKLVHEHSVENVVAYKGALALYNKLSLEFLAYVGIDVTMAQLEEAPEEPK